MVLRVKSTLHQTFSLFTILYFFCILVVMAMAERTDAAARSTLPQGLTYTSAEWMNIGFACQIDITPDFQQPHNIPPDIARPPCSAWTAVGPGRRRRRRRERKQKRGCRAGLLVRLRKQPVRPALPSIFWRNARSMVNKTDELELLMAENRHSRDCCVTIITETWLHLAAHHKWQNVGNNTSYSRRGTGLFLD